MAPAVLMSAAATAAMITTYSTYITSVASAGATAGAIGWAAAGFFRKVPCPSCTKMIRLRDYIDHAKGHTFQCPSCQDHVAFSDLEKHARKHGFRCPACYEEVPLADLGPHLDRHRRENDEERIRQGEHYQARVRELSRAYEERLLKIQRYENDCSLEDCRVVLPEAEFSCSPWIKTFGHQDQNLLMFLMLMKK